MNAMFFFGGGGDGDGGVINSFLPLSVTWGWEGCEAT